MSLVNREEEIVNENTVEIIQEKPKMGFFNKLKNILFILLILFVGYSIGSGIYSASKVISVDNPTGSGIIIQFNDMSEVKISANTFIKIPLEPGIYSLKVNGVEMGKFEKKFMSGNAFLNPTNQIYISEFAVYGDESGYDKLPNNKIRVYGNEAEGPFKQYDGIYINGSWDYSLDKDFPLELKVKSSYKIKEKLYRFKDFVDMYNRDYIGDNYEDIRGAIENLIPVSPDENGIINVKDLDDNQKVLIPLN